MGLRVADFPQRVDPQPGEPFTTRQDGGTLSVLLGDGRVLHLLSEAEAGVIRLKCESWKKTPQEAFSFGGALVIRPGGPEGPASLYESFTASPRDGDVVITDDGRTLLFVDAKPNAFMLNLEDMTTGEAPPAAACRVYRTWTLWDDRNAKKPRVLATHTPAPDAGVAPATAS